MTATMTDLESAVTALADSLDWDTVFVVSTTGTAMTMTFHSRDDDDDDWNDPHRSRQADDHL